MTQGQYPAQHPGHQPLQPYASPSSLTPTVRQPLQPYVPSPGSLPPEPKPPRRSRIWLILGVVAAAVLIVLSGIGVALLLNSSRPGPVSPVSLPAKPDTAQPEPSLRQSTPSPGTTRPHPGAGFKKVDQTLPTSVAGLPRQGTASTPSSAFADRATYGSGADILDLFLRKDPWAEASKILDGDSSVTDRTTAHGASCGKRGARALCYHQLDGGVLVVNDSLGNRSPEQVAQVTKEVYDALT